MSIRIIPRLDIKGSNLVKGIHLEGLRVLGKPEFFAKYYYENGADELIYIDIVASLYGRNNLVHIVEKTSKEIFIPLTVGGGVRSLEDIQCLLRSGADKVALNTAAIRSPELIRDASRTFGSSTIVISIEAIKRPQGHYECFTDNGRVSTGINVIDWVRKAEELGAGEILLTSVDREGTGKGYDVDLVKLVSDAVTIPVIACGGAGKMEHLRDVILNGKAQAVALSSVLHYKAIRHMESMNVHFTEGNTVFIKSGEGYSKVDELTLTEVKSFLSHSIIRCRVDGVTV